MFDPEITIYKNVLDTTGKPISLSRILHAIKNGYWKTQIEKLRGITEEKEQKIFKNTLPCCTPSGVFNTRAVEGLKEHSGILVIDIDTKENPGLLNECNKIRQCLVEDKHTCFLFTSCRGSGLAVGVRIDKTKHIDTFEFLYKYYKDTYGLNIDKGCKDVSRLRFISYDPDLYRNEWAETVIVPPDFMKEAKCRHTTPASYANGKNHEIIKAIVASGKLLGDDRYETWLRIGFALVSEFGEAGRPYFHELSRISPKYDPMDCDRKFDNCLKTNRGDVTFATIVHMAKEKGIVLKDVSVDVLELKVSTIQDMLQYERPEYLVKPIIYQKTVNLLTSLPGVGKSISSFSIAAAVASNKELWGHFQTLKNGKVLIIDEENPGSIHRSRIEKIGIDRDTPIHFIHYQSLKVDNPKHLEALIKLINEKRYVLVIFDALIRLHRAKENDADEMAKVMQAFRELIKRTDTTVLIIHHERKSRDGERRERSRGSGDIVGAIDCQLVLEEGGEMDNGKALILYPGKTRLASFTPIRLAFNSDTLEITYVADILSSKKNIIQSIVQFIRDGIKDFEEIQQALDIPEKQLRTILKNALGKELILDSTLKNNPEYRGSPRKQFYKLHPNCVLSNVAMFPPIGGETCHIEESQPHREIQPGNMKSLDFAECGVVAEHVLPHCHNEKKYVSDEQKKVSIGNIENATKTNPVNSKNEPENVSNEPINLDALGVEL